jgi:hypothetical protein
VITSNFRSRVLRVMHGEKFRPIGDLIPLGSGVPPPESAVGRGPSARPRTGRMGGVGERWMAPLQHIAVKVSSGLRPAFRKSPRCLADGTCDCELLHSKKLRPFEGRDGLVKTVDPSA